MLSRYTFKDSSLYSMQPPMQAKGLDGLLRTSLDLELDLQVSRTRQARLAQELRVLRELKTQLEEARQQGQMELPVWVQEDERFRLLLKQAEKQVKKTINQRERMVHLGKQQGSTSVSFVSDSRGAATRETGREDDEGSSQGRPQN